MQELTKAHHSDQRRLTAVEFQTLAQVPAAVEWFANLDNPRTRRAYKNDLEDFCGFVGLASADEFRVVNRSHVTRIINRPIRTMDTRDSVFA